MKIKSIVYPSLIIFTSCIPAKTIVKSGIVDYTVPTITKNESGYYLTRCACYYFDSIVKGENIYPESMDELVELQKKGFTCSKYSYPVSWIK
jgi:hypothetical protein